MKVFAELFSKSEARPLKGISLLLTFLFVPLASKRKVAVGIDVIIVDAPILVGVNCVHHGSFVNDPYEVLLGVIKISLFLGCRGQRRRPLFYVPLKITR